MSQVHIQPIVSEIPYYSWYTSNIVEDTDVASENSIRNWLMENVPSLSRQVWRHIPMSVFTVIDESTEMREVL